MVPASHQVRRYRDFYRRFARLRWLFRFDVRHRCRRLREVLASLDFPVDGARVLDVGFGSGHLLRTFPPSAAVHGAEISESAVSAARADRRYRAYRSAAFFLVPEADVEALPPGVFDVVVSSHTLEHVPDDRAVVRAVAERLRPGGVFCVFVPVEEPGYNPDHVREYSVESLASLLAAEGFEVLFTEGSLHVNGHVWKILTIPSRRSWPVLGPLVDAFRCVTLSLLSYRGLLACDAALAAFGIEPRQAFVVARKPSASARPAAKRS